MSIHECFWLRLVVPQLVIAALAVVLYFTVGFARPMGIAFVLASLSDFILYSCGDRWDPVWVDDEGIDDVIASSHWRRERQGHIHFLDGTIAGINVDKKF